MQSICSVTNERKGLSPASKTTPHKSATPRDQWIDWSAAEGTGTGWRSSYPFALAGINIVQLIVDLLGLAVGGAPARPRSHNACVSSDACRWCRRISSRLTSATPTTPAPGVPRHLPLPNAYHGTGLAYLGAAAPWPASPRRSSR